MATPVVAARGRGGHRTAAPAAVRARATGRLGVGCMTGTAVLERLRCGDHVCAPVSDLAEQDGYLTAYATGGLRAGHKVLLFVDDPAALRRRLLAGVAAARAALRTGQLDLRPVRDTYFDVVGSLDGARLIEGLAAEVDEATAQGYPGLWVAGSLAGGSGFDTAEVIDYETRVNALFVDRPLVGLCLYDPWGWDATVWDALTRAHPSLFSPTDVMRGLRCRRTDAGIRLTGEVDFANAAAFASWLTVLAAWPGPCHVELADLGFADVRAATDLLDTAARRTQPTLLTCGTHLARTLALLGASTLPNVHVEVRPPR